MDSWISETAELLVGSLRLAAVEAIFPFFDLADYVEVESEIPTERNSTYSRTWLGGFSVECQGRSTIRKDSRVWGDHPCHGLV